MNLGDMNKMMKQMQKMQADLARVQDELEHKTVEASAGGGAVRVVCTGKQVIQKITIAPDAVDPDDVEMLQDLMTVAVNEALRQSQEMAAQAMAKVTGGLNLPNLPF